jgi:hypothetical protein
LDLGWLAGLAGLAGSWAGWLAAGLAGLGWLAGSWAGWAGWLGWLGWLGHLASLAAGLAGGWAGLLRLYVFLKQTDTARRQLRGGSAATRRQAAPDLGPLLGKWGCRKDIRRQIIPLKRKRCLGNNLQIQEQVAYHRVHSKDRKARGRQQRLLSKDRTAATHLLCNRPPRLHLQHAINQGSS